MEVSPSQSSPSKAKALEKFKIVFVGDQAVGKTSIIGRFFHDEFSEDYSSTIGIDVVTKTIKMNNEAIRVQLWDTAGQERFKSLIPSYIKQAHVAVVVYDITKKESFNGLQNWMDEIRQNKGDDINVVVAGNKADMVDNRVITADEGMKVAKENNATFIEVSAKSGENINVMFHDIATALMGPQAPVAPQHAPGVSLQNPTVGGSQAQENNSKCC